MIFAFALVIILQSIVIAALVARLRRKPKRLSFSERRAKMKRARKQTDALQFMRDRAALPRRGR